MRFISEIDVNNPLCYHDYLEAVRNMDFDKQSYSTLHQKSIDDENIPVFDMKAYINLICEVKDNKVIGFSKKIKVKLPVNEKNEPDFKFMERYIKSLPYSDVL